MTLSVPIRSLRKLKFIHNSLEGRIIFKIELTLRDEEALELIGYSYCASQVRLQN